MAKTVKKTAEVVMKLKRSPEGLKIYLKSKLIEDFFMNVSNNRTTESSSAGWKDKKGYILSNTLGDSNIRYDNWGGAITMYPFNFSFIRTVGITKGVTFEFNGVFSKEMITEMSSAYKTALVRLIKEYIKPMELIIKIYNNEII